jgi:ribosome-associated heat shock protein Hsp15
MKDCDRIRIDKWLWASRIYKTRNQAAEACKKGRVFVEGMPAKPSRILHPGNIVVVRKPPVIQTYEVVSLTAKRQAAMIARDNYRNLTPQEELEKLDFLRVGSQGQREKGTGRPTKKDRRKIDRLHQTKP